MSATAAAAQDTGNRARQAGSPALNQPARSRTDAALDVAEKLLRLARLKVPAYLRDDIDAALAMIAELRGDRAEG